MDSDNKFIQPKMYLTFRKEWLRGSFLIWEDFIERKDLGIICSGLNTTIGFMEYQIVDEKKWLISKIKYGF